MTGTFQFSGLANAITGTPGTDSNGNQTLTAAASITPQGSSQILVSYSGDTNYEEAAAYVFVTVNIPDFSFNVPQNPLLISIGQPGTLSIPIVPATSLPSSVALSCAGNAPIGYACGVSPTTVNLNGGVNGAFMLSLTPGTSGVGSAAKRATFANRFMNFPLGPAGLASVSVLAGLASLLLFAWPRGSVRWRMASHLISISLLSLALGCGSGSSSSGGTQQGPSATSTTVMTNMPKVAMQTPLTFTATVSGQGSPTGSVIFFANGSSYGTANLVGNTATLTTSIATPGIYTITAQYQGDFANNPSTSSGVNQAVTGSTIVSVEGQTNTLVHFANVTVTLQ
jgi:trimeric autotransporter adhesin